jgi:hypothetical protein
MTGHNSIFEEGAIAADKGSVFTRGEQRWKL